MPDMYRATNMSNYSVEELKSSGMGDGRSMSHIVKQTTSVMGEIYLNDGNFKIYPDATKSEYYNLNNNKGTITATINGVEYKGSGRKTPIYTVDDLTGDCMLSYYEWYIDDNGGVWLGVSIDLTPTSSTTMTKDVKLSNAYDGGKVHNDDVGNFSLLKTNTYEYDFSWVDTKDNNTTKNVFLIATSEFKNQSSKNFNVKLREQTIYDYDTKKYTTDELVMGNYDIKFTKSEAIALNAKINTESTGKAKLTVKGFKLVRLKDSLYTYFSSSASVNKLSNNTGSSILSDGTPTEAGGSDDENSTEEQTLDPLAEANDINEWVANNMSAQYAEELQYFEDLYGGYETVWSTRSFRSIIGMPFHFLQSTDPRVGSSCLGKQFIEDIVYDMPLVCLRPGGPVMNSSISGSSSSGGVLGLVKKFLSYHSYFINNNASTLATMLDAGDDTEVDSGDDTGLVDGVKTVLTNLFVGKYARYYTFGSDMTKYVEYVNTLCHIFISFLGIGDMYYKPGTQYESGSTQPEPRKYAYYNDTWETVEADGGDSMKFMQGPNQAIFGYYQPESSLNQTYSNTTRDSEMASAIDQGSSIAKEFHFLMGTATDKLTDLSNNIFESIGQINGNALVGRLFGNAAEGISTVIAGNNIDLPQIWDDSSGGAEHTLVFKLVSPYGDRESIFLYVLRPLARLLAMSLPRQFGPNSYTSPFLVQAFSKGQFNVQCGIVSSISIRRCGNGGESHTVHYIPTELEVTMTIQDMYGLVTLSNEYLGSANNTDGLLAHISSAINAISPFGAAKAARLLFNNIGLIDFCAAYCGYNLNAPEIDTMWTLLMDIWANRINDLVENPLTTGTSQWKSPKWAREMTDAFYGAVQKYLGFISG